MLGVTGSNPVASIFACCLRQPAKIPRWVTKPVAAKAASRCIVTVGVVELSGLLLVRYGGIAQLVEHLLCKQGVTGSNPVASMSAQVGLATELRSSPDPPWDRAELRASKAAAWRAPWGWLGGLFF